MNKQQGFTLIELVMVIVILGILAATAIPKFTNLQDDARSAAVDGLAGNLGAGSAINLAVRSIRPSAASTVAVGNCTDVANTLEGGLTSIGAATSAAITGGAITAGATAACTLTVSYGTTNVTAGFTGHGIN
jgi:MSHA pilin protein MshA